MQAVEVCDWPGTEATRERGTYRWAELTHEQCVRRNARAAQHGEDDNGCNDESRLQPCAQQERTRDVPSALALGLRVVRSQASHACAVQASARRTKALQSTRTLSTPAASVYLMLLSLRARGAIIHAPFERLGRARRTAANAWRALRSRTQQPLTWRHTRGAGAAGPQGGADEPTQRAPEAYAGRRRARSTAGRVLELSQLAAACSPPQDTELRLKSCLVTRAASHTPPFLPKGAIHQPDWRPAALSRARASAAMRLASAMLGRLRVGGAGSWKPTLACMSSTAAISAPRSAPA